MNRIITGLLALLMVGPDFGAQNEPPEDTLHIRKASSVDMIDPGETSNSGNYVNGNGIPETANRLPQLLRDVKVLLTDAIIADFHQDTLEVIFYLDRIFELLSEADQLGEMTPEDRDEFDEFESGLIGIYTSKLFTLKASDVAITAEQLRKEIIEIVEPLEVGDGSSKYIVLDDREGHIPLVTNKRVEQFIEFFKTKGRKQYNIWLARRAKYGSMIEGLLTEHEMPRELIFLAMIESGFNPTAYSRANAVGMWQFTYTTGKNYGLERNWFIDERRDPIKATHAACTYLKELYNEFDDWYLALAAYNYGPGRVRRAIRLHESYNFWDLHSLPRETRNYIPYYLAAAIIGNDPEKYGFKIPGNIEEYNYDEVPLEKSASLAVLAKSAGVSVKVIRDYNPELRQSATPRDETYYLKIPKGKYQTFVENFNAIPESNRYAPQHINHKVRRGESLWTISKKYGVPIHDLAAVNKIPNRHKIKIGQTLSIPVKGSMGSRIGPSGNRDRRIVYVVKKGDTLGHIAENHNTRASKIRYWNGLNYGQHIHPGQKLTLWVKAS